MVACLMCSGTALCPFLCQHRSLSYYASVYQSCLTTSPASPPFAAAPAPSAGPRGFSWASVVGRFTGGAAALAAQVTAPAAPARQSLGQVRSRNSRTSGSGNTLGWAAAPAPAAAVAPAVAPAASEAVVPAVEPAAPTPAPPVAEKAPEAAAAPTAGGAASPGEEEDGWTEAAGKRRKERSYSKGTGGRGQGGNRSGGESRSNGGGNSGNQRQGGKRR